MHEVVTVILIFCGIMLIAAVVFGGWLIVAIARWVTRMISSMVSGGGGSSQPLAMAGPTPHGVRCGQPKCRTVNPEQARFCRRCGRMLKVEGHAVRRVAMW